MKPETRPQLSPALTAAELRRWYWLKAELADLARQLRLSTAGGKDQLTDRLAAALDGEAVVTRPPAARPAAAQLSGELTLETVIPPGQRSSQTLRAFFETQLGPGFRFDGAMRAFIADGAGKSLAEAVAFWRRRQSEDGDEPSEIAPQFELNRFTRRWHLEHPEGNRPELVAAWQDYRRRPVDERGRA